MLYFVSGKTNIRGPTMQMSSQILHWEAAQRPLSCWWQSSLCQGMFCFRRLLSLRHKAEWKFYLLLPTCTLSWFHWRLWKDMKRYVKSCFIVCSKHWCACKLCCACTISLEAQILVLKLRESTALIQGKASWELVLPGNMKKRSHLWIGKREVQTRKCLGSDKSFHKYSNVTKIKAKWIILCQRW